MFRILRNIYKHQKKVSKTIGALSEVNFIINQLLLRIILVATCFKQLKTFNGDLIKTFQKSCRCLRLLNNFHSYNQIIKTLFCQTKTCQCLCVFKEF